VGTPVNYLAITVMAISGIKSMFDLNPFIKLDGYYILSDALEIPNLRRRAFKYVGDGIKRVLGFGQHVATEVSRRDKRVLVIYGLIATVSSFALLAVGLEKAGSLLIQNDQPLALVFLTGYAGMRLMRRLKRLFWQKASGGAAPGHGASNPAAPTPGASAPPSADAATPRPPKKPRVPIGKLLRRLAWAAAAAGALVYVFKGYTELSVTGPFTVLPEHNADVRAEVEGIIESVRTDEGTFVQTGALIARMSDKDLRAELAKTNADIEQARALLRKQEAGPTQAEIDIAKAAAARAADASTYAQAKLDRISPLFKAGRVSGQEFDDAQEQARLTANDRAAADGQLRLVTAGTRPEDVDATKAQIDGLATHASLVAAQLKGLDILSPATGVVATPSRELHALRGQHVNKGDLIAKVYTVKTVTAQMSVGEKELADVHVGLPVLLRARAYPDVVFHGTVTAIATAAEGMSSNTSPVSGSTPPGTTPAAGAGNAFVVTTEIDNSAGVLKPGMTGLAKISDGRRRVADVLWQRVERTLKVEVWSWL
jgi:multidrug resistance efflux pump